MKKLILIITSLVLIGPFAISQEISENPKSDLLFYGAVFSEQCKTTDNRLPKGFTVSGEMLTYLDEFLAKKSFASGLKKYISENGWAFLKEVDTAGKLKQRQYVETKRLASLLGKGVIISKKSNELFFTFSPIIFSKDRTKAFLVFDKANKGELLGVTACFFEFKNGKWKLVNTMVPYLI